MTGRKRILIAWEMGENFGHAVEIAQLIKWLDGDFEFIAAVRDPVTVRSIVSDSRLQVTAAPYAPDTPVSKGDRALNYPDVLRYVGWQDQDALAAYLEAWEVLLGLVRPDVLVAQAAPTALLAARAMGIPRVSIGSGYCCPPRSTPMPRLHNWEPEDRAELERRDGRVLETVNGALRSRGYGSLSVFSDLLDVDRCLLTTLPELDHYADRAAIEPDHPPYLGPIVGTHFGAELSWRSEGDYRVFAYLRPGNPRFQAALRALASLPPDHDVVLAAPGAASDLASKLENTPVRLIPGPVKLGRLLKDCNIGIGHASSGLAASFALAGIPQIGMPNHTEQTMIAYALSRNHLGLGLIGKATPEHILKSIDVIKTSEIVVRGTSDLAARWRTFRPDCLSESVTTEITALL